jgi:(R,R)-butanediol dehydrogenase/meso-butanediol dehydrogenase/diacetyl reductase
MRQRNDDLMKAAVYRGPHAVDVEEYPEPADPGPSCLTLKVSRAAICGTDASEWRHGPLLVRPPVVLGHEFTGTVVATGEGAAAFSVGDRIVCGAGESCGQCEWCAAGRNNLCTDYRTYGLHIDGGLAQYVTVPQSICLRLPAGVGDTAAAMAQPLAVALHAVRRSGLRSGQTCAVIGAGGIGAFVIAAAAVSGADPLIAFDLDDSRLVTARRLGASQTANVRGKDLAKAILEQTDGAGAHVVIEATGVGEAPAAALAGTRRGGTTLLVGLQSAPRELDLFAMTAREVSIVTTLAHVCDSDLPESLRLLAERPLADIVLDRVIPLADLVESGLRPLADGTARGKIVVDTGAS